MPAAKITYSTPLLKSTGPTANQVSSLNSFVGVKTLLITDGALCDLKPRTPMKKTRPANHNPASDRPIFLPLLMPCFFCEASVPVGTGAVIALIAKPPAARAAGR